LASLANEEAWKQRFIEKRDVIRRMAREALREDEQVTRRSLKKKLLRRMTPTTNGWSERCDIQGLKTLLVLLPRPIQKKAACAPAIGRFEGQQHTRPTVRAQVRIL
jgi:hypothetical protein